MTCARLPCRGAESVRRPIGVRPTRATMISPCSCARVARRTDGRGDRLTPQASPTPPGRRSVGLNLIYLVPGYTGGTETYARELIPELVAAAPETRFTAFINREAAEAGDGPWGDLIPAVVVPVRARNRAAWVLGEQQLLPIAARRRGIDLLHSLANTAPDVGTLRPNGDDPRPAAPDRARGAPRDAGPRHARAGDRRRPTLGTRPRRRAEHTRRPPAAAGDRPRDAWTSSRSAWALAGRRPRPRRRCGRCSASPSVRWCSRVSALRPHKNLIRLIDAVALIAPERRPLLVIVGYPTDHETDLRREIDALGIEHRRAHPRLGRHRDARGPLRGQPRIRVPLLV